MLRRKCWKRLPQVLNCCTVVAVWLYFLVRLHNLGYLTLNFRSVLTAASTSRVELVNRTGPVANKAVKKVPWRYHIENDGFVFPADAGRKRQYIVYHPDGTWAEQVLQFENAVIFAFLLKRTLVVPPLTTSPSEHSRAANTPSLARLLDLFALAKVVEMVHAVNMSNLTVHKICHDPSFGIWLDYIPSVENIQTWRQLKQQQFRPFNVKINGVPDMANRTILCPGTHDYYTRWLPPLNIKPSFRGILSELGAVTHDVIEFQSNTMRTRDLRFFDKQRTWKAQEILVFYVRLAMSVNLRLNFVASHFLGLSYDAVLLHSDATDQRNATDYVRSALLEANSSTVSKVIYIDCKRHDRQIFAALTKRGYRIYYKEELMNRIERRYRQRMADHEKHFYSLLLCAYSRSFFSSPRSPDLYFVEHLRLQNSSLKDGLVVNKLSVKWAKHTTRLRPDDVIKARVKPMQKVKANVSKPVKVLEKHAVTKKQPRDQLNSMICLVCAYFKRITGERHCNSTCP